MKKKERCQFCQAFIDKDTEALNRKMLNPTVKKLLCIRCLAEYLGCLDEDLKVKIKEFKEQGCHLFG